MYRYMQEREKGKWHAFSSSAGLGTAEVSEAIKRGARKITILSVSEVVDEFTDKEKLSYQGPLYFDIDCKEDIYLAIKSARELVQKLLDMEVQRDCILVYCSGSKGMHVLVDERAFSTGRPVKLLPKVYREIAKSLYVFGLDYQVYSGGRGVSWRIVNKQRDDGKYRVNITLEELETLTPEIYQEYVSAPRAALSFPENVDKGHSPALATLFDRGKQVVNRLQKESKPRAELTEDAITEISQVIPQCIHDLCDGKAIKSANFNEIAFQLAVYLANVKAPSQVVSSLSGRLAGVTESTSYNTERKRLQHIVGLAGYTSSASTNYKFSCGAMRGILSTKPCEGCPINGKRLTNGGADNDIDLGVVEKEDGYYIVNLEGERRVSTFTLEILDYHAEQQQDGSLERRTGFKAKVKAKGINCADYAEIFMSESMWRNKSSLVGEIEGITNIVFLGSDTDVQKVKNHVFSKASTEAGKITAVYTAGIIPQKIGPSKIKVYVESEGSINQMKTRDTHYLNADIVSPPKLLDQPMPQAGDQQLSDTLYSLMSINTPVNMSMVLGWHVACHFKMHLVEIFNQFPLLSVWGPAGVGKTMTVVQACWLNGCDYTAEHAPINATEASEWSLIDYCSSTTTVPRILDEANESKMRNKYARFAEVVKSAWGNQTITRGSIRKTGATSRGRTGAHTVTIPISSPLIVISEQSLTMPAMQQRSVQVFLTRDARNQEHEQHFIKVTDTRHKLREMGKAFMVQALTTKDADLKAMVNEQRELVPRVYDDRPRYSFAVVLTGLKLLRQMCSHLELDELVCRKADELYEAALRHITDSVEEILLEKSRTEIDLILADMGLMASLTASGMGKELVEGVHFLLHGKNLVLDYKTAFPLYLQYCSKNRKDVAVRDIRQFHALIRQEPYFLEEGVIPAFATRPVMVLDGERLQAKGVDLSLFGYQMT